MGILFIVVLVDMIGIGIVIPFLTYMVEFLSPQGADLGIWVAGLMAAYAGAMFLFSPFWGSLSDRIGRRPVLMIGLAGNSFWFIVFGLSASLQMALFARLMAGVFNANLSVTRAYIGDVSEPHEVARRQGMLGVAFGLGFTLGPALGGLLSNPAAWGFTSVFQGTVFDSHPYLLPCLASSLLSAIGLLVATTRLAESLPRTDPSDDPDGSPSADPDAAVSDRPAARREVRNPLVVLCDNFSAIGRMLVRPRIAPALWSMTLYWTGFTIMHVVFILFTMMAVADGGLGFDETQNGWVFAFIGLCGIITQGRLIGPLTDRYGSSRLMTVGLVIAGIGLASIPYALPSAAMLSVLASAALISFGNGLVTPSNMTILTHLSGAGERGSVMGVSESLRALASLVGVLIGGVVWDLTVHRDDMFDFHTAFRLCGLFALAAMLAFRFSSAYGASEESLAASSC